MTTKEQNSSQKVEICEDMSCVIFNETGLEICKIIENWDEYPISKLHGCILEALVDIETKESFSNLFIGKAWKKDCVKW